MIEDLLTRDINARYADALQLSGGRSVHDPGAPVALGVLSSS